MTVGVVPGRHSEALCARVDAGQSSVKRYGSLVRDAQVPLIDVEGFPPSWEDTMIGREKLVFIRQQIHFAYRHCCSGVFACEAQGASAQLSSEGQDRSTEFNNKSALKDARQGLRHLLAL